MIEINLALVATAIGIVASIWRFANSISKFGHSVDELTKSMEESRKDRLSLRKAVNRHETAIEIIKSQYEDIKEDYTDIKVDLKEIKKESELSYMEILEYVVSEGLVMIPVLYILGEIIKHSEVIANKWIPGILLGISLGFTPLLLGAYTPDNIVQAVLVAGATVFVDQLYKQTKENE